jgi:drug/metabolite transporter (DMT)-like permease
MKLSATSAAAAPRSRSHTAAEAMMLAATFFWASNIVAGKVALTAFSALALAQLRMAAAAILYIVVYAAWRGLPPLRLGRREWGLMALMALTGITANQIFYIGGLDMTSVTHAGLIQAIGPIAVLLLSAAMGREPLTVRKIIGMAVAFLGVAVLLFEKPGSGSGAHWTGDVVMILACAVFAYYTILTKQVANRYDPLVLNVYVFALGALFLIPFCGYSTAMVAWGRIPAGAWLGLAYMVLFGSFVAYLIYAFALERLSASNVAAFAYLQPVMAALLGLWLLGERISTPVVIGGALILGGLYLTERARGSGKHMTHLATGRV